MNLGAARRLVALGLVVTASFALANFSQQSARAAPPSNDNFADAVAIVTWNRDSPLSSDAKQMYDLGCIAGPGVPSNHHPR